MAGLLMGRSHGKNKGRGASVSFAGIPRVVMDSPDYQGLSGNSVKLLLELCAQYRGKNNGDLTAAYSVVKPRGCGGAKDTLKKIIKELLEARMIIRTREGVFMNPGARCALYALAWAPIDECPGKGLDVKPIATPSRKFSLRNINKTPSPEIGLSTSQKLGRVGARNTKGQWQSSQKLGRLRGVP